jgi:hypothetical protein
MLTLHHIFPNKETPVADVLGGWDAHLDTLAAGLRTGFQAKTAALAAAAALKVGDQCKPRILDFAERMRISAIAQ